MSCSYLCQRSPTSLRIKGKLTLRMDFKATSLFYSETTQTDNGFDVLRYPVLIRKHIAVSDAPKDFSL